MLHRKDRAGQGSKPLAVSAHTGHCWPMKLAPWPEVHLPSGQIRRAMVEYVNESEATARPLCPAPDHASHCLADG